MDMNIQRSDAEFAFFYLIFSVENEIRQIAGRNLPKPLSASYRRKEIGKHNFKFPWPIDDYYYFSFVSDDHSMMSPEITNEKKEEKKIITSGNRCKCTTINTNVLLFMVGWWEFDILLCLCVYFSHRRSSCFSLRRTSHGINDKPFICPLSTQFTQKKMCQNIWLTHCFSRTRWGDS